MAQTGVGLGRLEEVGSPVGDALEHGPDQLRPPGTPGDAEEGAPGAEVPDRRAQPEEGGDEPHVAGVVAAAATAADSSAVSMMPRSSRSHSTHVPADSMTASTPQTSVSADAPGDDGEGASAPPGG